VRPRCSHLASHPVDASDEIESGSVDNGSHDLHKNASPTQQYPGAHGPLDHELYAAQSGLRVPRLCSQRDRRLAQLHCRHETQDASGRNRRMGRAGRVGSGRSAMKKEGGRGCGGKGELSKPLSACKDAERGRYCTRHCTLNKKLTVIFFGSAVRAETYGSFWGFKPKERRKIS
jgi:hypothetical protein